MERGRTNYTDALPPMLARVMFNAVNLVELVMDVNSLVGWEGHEALQESYAILGQKAQEIDNNQ